MFVLFVGCMASWLCLDGRRPPPLEFTYCIGASLGWRDDGRGIPRVAVCGWWTALDSTPGKWQQTCGYFPVCLDLYAQHHRKQGVPQQRLITANVGGELREQVAWVGGWVVCPSRDDGDGT